MLYSNYCHCWLSIVFLLNNLAKIIVFPLCNRYSCRCWARSRIVNRHKSMISIAVWAVFYVCLFCLNYHFSNFFPSQNPLPMWLIMYIDFRNMRQFYFQLGSLRMYHVVVLFRPSTLMQKFSCSNILANNDSVKWENWVLQAS